MSDKNLNIEKNYGPSYVGNVIRILDNRTLIVNTGEDILSEGDTIAVYIPVEPIYDLDGRELAVYEYTKDKLEVIDTNQNYSVCQKKETKITEPSTFSNLALSPLFESKKEFVPLDVNEEDISPLSKIDSKIHIGDPIKLI